MSTFYLTTPIYYVNDKPHLGSGGIDAGGMTLTSRPPFHWMLINVR